MSQYHPFALRTAVVATFLLFASGCASIQVSKSAAARIKKVGVVSIMGDRFQGRYLGTTVFNNKFYVADVSSWHIDRTLEDYAIGSLRRAKFDTGRLDLSPHTADDYYKKGLFNQGLDMHLFHALPALAAKQGFDTLVVIMKPFDLQSKAFVPGYGFAERKFLGLSVSSLFASFTLIVYDTKTGRQLAHADGVMTGKELAKDKGIEWKPSFAAYTDAQKEMIERRVKRRLRREFDLALPDTHLIAAGQ